MFPLGIIPGIIGVILFYGYLNEKDEINRYLFLVFGIAFMFLSFFAPAEMNVEGAFVADQTLTTMGTAFGIIFAIFLLLLGIRLLIPAVWSSIKNYFHLL
jgi:hypothetical protein